MQYNIVRLIRPNSLWAYRRVSGCVVGGIEPASVFLIRFCFFKRWVNAYRAPFTTIDFPFAEIRF